MDAINLEPKGDTPKVVLDKASGTFEFIGKSLPEDVTSFYNPIIEWLDKYNEDPNDSSEFNFKMEYFNTASSKMILQILEKIKELKEKGKDVTVNWHYPDDDEDMEEAGEDYSSLVEIDFEMISYQADD
jgi:hypothetical protein